MTLTTVTFSGNGHHHETRIRTKPGMEREEIIDRAVVKIFGSRCFWLRDSGVPGYGQVFEALHPTKRNSEPGNSAVTPTVHLKIKE